MWGNMGASLQQLFGWGGAIVPIALYSRGLCPDVVKICSLSWCVSCMASVRMRIQWAHATGLDWNWLSGVTDVISLATTCSYGMH